MKRNYLFYLFAVPALIYFAVFIVYPLINGFIISLQEFGVMGPKGFVGFENYLKLAKHPLFLNTVRNTFIIALGILIPGVTLPAIVAILIAEVRFKRYQHFVQTMIYIPRLFSIVVIVGLFRNFFSATGIVNSALINLGIMDKSITFFTHPVYSVVLLVVLTIWKDIGYTSIIYYASIMGIDPFLYEAADIDGATFFQKARYITLPSLVPTMKIMTILIFMGAMRTFEQSYLIMNGGNYKTVQTLAVFTFEQGVLKFNMGLASGAAIILFLFTLVFVSVVKRIIKY